jgi:hypothetical protein
LELPAFGARGESRREFGFDRIPQEFGEAKLEPAGEAGRQAH